MNCQKKTTIATEVAGIRGKVSGAECSQGALSIHSKPVENALMHPWAALRLLGLGPLLPFEAENFSLGGYFRDFLRIPA
jgi:hypothetical protein